MTWNCQKYIESEHHRNCPSKYFFPFSSWYLHIKHGLTNWHNWVDILIKGWHIGFGLTYWFRVDELAWVGWHIGLGCHIGTHHTTILLLHSNAETRRDTIQQVQICTAIFFMSTFRSHIFLVGIDTWFHS